MGRHACVPAKGLRACSLWFLLWGGTYFGNARRPEGRKSLCAQKRERTVFSFAAYCMSHPSGTEWEKGLDSISIVDFII